MLRPVLVNIEIIDEKGNGNIVASVIDFHPSEIHRMIRAHDDMTYITDLFNVEIKVLLPFQVAVKIYDDQSNIDKTYEENVKEYYDNNYESLKDILRGESN